MAGKNHKCKGYNKRKKTSSSGSSSGNTKTPRNGSSPEFTSAQTKDNGNGEQKCQNTNQEVSDSLRKANSVLFDSLTTDLDNSVFEQGTCTQKVGTSDDGAHSTKYVSNEDIMTFLKQLEQRFYVKWKHFDQRLEAVDTRLKALASLETKVQSFEKELKGITTYVYKNVKSNTE